ncbi:hypothetical protein [Microvirga terricola]|uniref:Uncharacterized protein n=1 Tax=Microvirga terricola TaxID=2719797 RepID=A0ABX0VF21_9HYPH|nr:hypothetical protein [Microvirga terricola]NIX78444.1 hypothetical protein [Microvirga terricola]
MEGYITGVVASGYLAGGAVAAARAILGAALKSGARRVLEENNPPSGMPTKDAAGVNTGYKDFSRTYETPAGPVSVEGRVSFEKGQMNVRDLDPAKVN